MDGVKDLLQKERKDESGAITKGANLSNDQASQIIEFLKIKDIKSLKSNIKNNISQEGINEIEDLFSMLSKGKFSNLVKTNLNQALHYYSMMTPKIEAGKANKQEMDAYELLGYYLNEAAPKQPMQGGSMYI